MHRVLLLSGLAALALAGTGCVKPYLKAASELPAEPRRPALLATAVVDATSCPTAGGVSMDLTEHDAEFKRTRRRADKKCSLRLSMARQRMVGELMIEESGEFLGRYGLDLYTNRLQATRIGMTKDKTMNALGSLLGVWVSPESSNYRLEGGHVSAKMLANKLDSNQPGEVFVFITAYLHKRRSWLGMVKTPRLEMDVHVLDENGKRLFELRTTGDGNGRFLFVNGKPENLQRAMRRGLKKLEKRLAKEGITIPPLPPEGTARATPTDDPLSKPGDAIKDAPQIAAAPTADDPSGDDATTPATDAEPAAAETAQLEPAEVEPPPTESEPPPEVEPPTDFDPSAPPPRSLADRTDKQHAAATATSDVAPSTAPAENPPPSLADRPSDAPRSLSDRGDDTVAEPTQPSKDESPKTEDETEAPDDPGASAQHRVGLALRMGFGGNARPVYSKDEKERLPNDFEAPKLPLATSAGGMLTYDFILHPAFSVGARAELFAWQSELENFVDDKRHKVLNFNAVAKLRAPVRASALYLGAMFGPSFTFPASSLNDGLDLARARGTYNFGLLGGVEILGNSQAPSVFVEGGYSEQQVRYRRKTFLVGGADEVLRMKFWQMTFNIGVTYGL